MKRLFGDSSEQLKERLRRIVQKPNFFLAAEIALLASVVLITGLCLVGALQEPQQPEAAQLEKIEITAMPYRCVYVSGQQLDTAGMELTLTYSDGKTERITEGFACSPQVLEGSGKQTVTVTSYEKIATFEVELAESVLSGSCGETLSWDLTADGDLIISGSGRMDDYVGDETPWKYMRHIINKVYLPEGLQSIGDSAFKYCYDLAEIRIPETVSSIGKEAFYSCSALRSCCITGKVRDIEHRTFCGCENLQEVLLPQDLLYIGPLAFASCENLQSITLPDGLTTIDYSAFSGAGLRQITIPDGVTSIPYTTFKDCENLRSIDLPSSLTTIGDGAFSGCTALKSIQIPARMSSLNSRVFCKTGIERFTVAPGSPHFVTDDQGAVYTRGFEKLVVYPVARKGSYAVAENCTAIGNYAFVDCEGLTDITLPDTLQDIEDNAFFGCNGLTRVTVPKSVKTIGYHGFSGCMGLMELYIMNASCSIKVGLLSKEDQTVIYSYAGSAVQQYARERGYRFSALQA